MEKQEIISSGLLEMYVIGAASQEEMLQVDQWRLQYAEVNEEIIKIEKAFEAYAFANAIPPSASLKSQLLSTFNAAQKKPFNNSTAKLVGMSPWRKIAAAAILLLITSSIFNVVNYNKYKAANNKYNEGQQQIALLNENLDARNKDMGIVQSKYSEPVSLKGLEVSPDAGAKIFWMKNTGDVYVDPTNLPALPAGKQYQLWAIVDGKPIDAGLIDSKSGSKYSIQKMKTFGKAQAFAITLETEGGNPEPKGTMYVMGKI